jgi:hypothetical protein
MPTLDITIPRVNREAAKHICFKHLWRVGPLAGAIALYMTDERGRVRNEDGNLGIDSLTNEADIRTLGQNLVARILGGGSVPLIILPVWVDTQIRDGWILDRPQHCCSEGGSFSYIELGLVELEWVHKRFPPFSRLPSGKLQFALGKQRTLQQTKDQSERIEICVSWQSASARCILQANVDKYRLSADPPQG